MNVAGGSVIFVNENVNENGEKRENNEFCLLYTSDAADE